MQLKAYNPAWAWNGLVREQAARWQRQHLLSAAQHAAIEATYPLDYYRPAWPLRVGLFLFTYLAIGLSGGFFFFVFYDLSSGTRFPVVLMGTTFFVGCLLMLEFNIREKKLYRSGIDNALLYSALSAGSGLIFYAFGYNQLTTSSNTTFFTALWPIGALIVTLALMLAAVARYADAVAAVAAFAVYLLLVAFAAFLVSAVLGHVLLPFLLMLAAAGAYALQRRVARRTDAYYYQSCLNTIKVTALIIFYLAGNYLIVREGNAMLGDFSPSRQIPFAPLFYLLTSGIPLAYIALGLRWHDRRLLLVGLLTLAFSFFTLRYYRSLMPPEIAATVGGAVLIILSGAALRYLRPARYGLTSEADDEPRHFNLENLIVSQTTTVPDAPVAGFAFGGGQSGGGGATGNY